jgi:hypothetical protein
LQARGIPFVLSTGYEVNEVIPDFLQGSKFVRKPYQLEELERCILDIIK